jgi:hypothetical protein
MTDHPTIEPITDPVEIDRLALLVEEVVEKPFHLRPEWLRKNRLAAVPVESASHFYEREAEWLAQAARSIGCGECFAVATEPLENTVLCYRVPATQEAFLAFSRECFSLNYVLIPEDRSFAVLCTSEDYYVVAGSQSFVTKAAGSGIDTARKMFLRAANDITLPGADRERLLAVAKRYEPFDGE